MGSSASRCMCRASTASIDLNFNGRDGDDKVTYGDVFLQAEQEYSRHNFEYADTEMLFEQFRMAEDACRNISTLAGKDGKRERRI